MVVAVKIERLQKRSEIEQMTPRVAKLGGTAHYFGEYRPQCGLPLFQTVCYLASVF